MLTDYAEGFRSLLRLPARDSGGHPIPAYALKLDDEATELLISFVAELEPQFGESGALHHMRDWGAKLAGAVGRLSGLLHLATHASHLAPWELPVTRTIMADALRLGRYYIAHAKRAYGAMGGDPLLEHAKRVTRWLQHKQLTVWSERDCFSALRDQAWCKTMDDLRPVLAVLVRYGYIRRAPSNLEPRAATGRPASPRYNTNPSLTAQYSHNPQNEVGVS